MDYTKDPKFLQMDDATKHQFLADTDPAYKGMAPALQAEFRSQFKHPWVQTNEAARSGKPVSLGQNYPGAGYVPSKGEAAADVGMLGATLAAGPLATAATGSAVVAPALARAGVQAAPSLLTKPGMEGVMEAGKRAGVSLGVDALFSLLGLPAAARSWQAARTTPPPPPTAVHQAANFAPPQVMTANAARAARLGITPAPGPQPITFPAVGNQPPVTVAPPTGGAPITRGSSPAVIVQGSMPRTPPAPRPPFIGEGGRAAGVAGAEQDPEKSGVGLLWLKGLLGDYASRAVQHIPGAAHVVTP